MSDLKLYEPKGCDYCQGSMDEMLPHYESEKAWGYVTYGTYEALESQLSSEKARSQKLLEALQKIATSDKIEASQEEIYSNKIIATFAIREYQKKEKDL